MDPNLAQFVKTWIKGWKTHDGKMLQDLFAADGSYRDPYFGKVNRERVPWMIQKLSTKVRSLDFEVVESVVTQSEPDEISFVCLQWHMSGYVRVVGLGRRLQLAGADFIKLQKMKIQSATTYFDRMEALRQAVRGF